MRFNLPRLIGITGRAGVGKDTLADYLVRQFGYTKYSLAKPLKDMLNKRFGWTDEMWLDREWKERAHWQCGFRYTNEGPEGLSPRSWAQWLGTEVGRVTGGEDVWVDMMEREYSSRLRYVEVTQLGRSPVKSYTGEPLMVVPDVRFDNEARRIHNLGGVVIRIMRDVEAVNSHVSELGLYDEPVNAQVVNDKDIITFLRESIYALEQVPQPPEQLDAPLESGDELLDIPRFLRKHND